jgi:hypothetical protein
VPEKYIIAMARRVGQNYIAMVKYARTGKYDGEIGESRYFESGRESGVDAVQEANVDVAWT